MRTCTRRVARECDGQSLLETALFLPILCLLMAYAVDYGYFFLAAANITSAARVASVYAVQGYQAPAQSSLAPAGPTTSATSVAALALGGLDLAGAATSTSVQVCSKVLGMNGSLPVCGTYGASGSSYAPAVDPESPTFVLQRVDVTYTVQPPVPLTFFSVPLISTMKFHRQVSMRVMD